MSTLSHNAVHTIHLLDTLGIPALYCDKDGLIQLVNEPLAALVMSDAHHLQGMDVDELTAFVNVTDLIENGQPVLSPLPRRVGELSCLVRIQTVGDEGFILTFEDVTDYHERETQLHDSIRMVVHDLKTPIAAIKNYVYLVAQLSDLSDQSAKFLDRIQTATDILTAIMNDLIDLAWIDTNRPLDLQSVPLEHILNPTLGSVQTLAQQADVTLGIDIQPDLPSIMGDQPRLQRVFVNLLANAIKFSPAHSTVTVQATRKANLVTVAVTDCGPGIEAQYLPYIFERFYRVPLDKNQTEQPTSQGSGLGLAIVREIVERHGGEVRVDSEVGAGTTFTVGLPTSL